MTDDELKAIEGRLGMGEIVCFRRVDLVALIAEVRAVRARVASAEAVIDEVEWAALDSRKRARCPECWAMSAEEDPDPRVDHHGTHSPDCKIRKHREDRCPS